MILVKQTTEFWFVPYYTDEHRQRIK